MGGISLGNYVIAIDSGRSYKVGATLRRELESSFKVPVRRLFLTHTHTDHRKGMDAFTDIPMVASRKCIENMPRSVRLRERVVEVFDDELTIGDENLRVEFHLVSGHSVGSSVAYIPDEKVLFGGDLCLSSSFHYGMPIMHYYQNRPKRTGNPDEYIAAFQKIRKWKVETIVPGHGNIIICARDYIDDQISFFTELKSFFISSIDEGMTLENIEMPNLRSISEAYSNASARTQKSQSIRSLDHILELLKISFYNHYSRVS